MMKYGELSREKRYHRYQLQLSIGEFLLGLAFLVVILLAGFTLHLENWLRAYLSNDYLVLIGFVLILGLAESLLLFPLSFLSGFILEHHFELSDQSLGAWLWEKAKGLLIGGPVGLIFVLIFYALLLHYPQNWWFIMGSVMLLFSVVFARLAPILIFPLFYKFEKIADQELAHKIAELCSQVGMRLEGIYQFNLSKSTRKANAAFTGLGKSRRVILGDTLLQNLEHSEILSVLAHELGHSKLRHIRKSIGINVVSSYLGLFLVAKAYGALLPQLAFDYVAQIAALPLVALILTLYQFITSPVLNAYSRANERAADDFAVALMGESDSFISGLDKISDRNLSDRTPHPLVEFLFYSHPSTEKRLARLKQQSI